jgi:hypothetical protein
MKKALLQQSSVGSTGLRICSSQGNNRIIYNPREVTKKCLNCHGSNVSLNWQKPWYKEEPMLGKRLQKQVNKEIFE